MELSEQRDVSHEDVGMIVPFVLHRIAEIAERLGARGAREVVLQFPFAAELALEETFRLRKID